MHALGRVEKRHARLSAGSMEKQCSRSRPMPKVCFQKKMGNKLGTKGLAIGGCERGGGQSVVVITKASRKTTPNPYPKLAHTKPRDGWGSP